MAKPIHMMIRVLDEARSVSFYRRAFNMAPADRYGFDGFTLVYLRAPDSEFEIELTVNHGRSEPYTHGDGYGHVAVCVDDLDAEHARFTVEGLSYDPKLPEATSRGLDATIQDARDMLMVLQNGKAIDPQSQDNLVASLAKQASPAHPVYATVIYTLYPERGNVGFHAILVTGVKDGFVSYINPWVQEEKLSEKAFKASILSADVRQ